jgi:pimeloyl-ACP methyl ester carboxylesterase
MVMIRGIDLVHDLGGSGADLIWGHGLTSSMVAEDEFGLIDWATIRSSLRVLRYDARGHGRSGSTPDPASYSWRSLAEDQLALADHLGIESFVAGGASMGCATALHAAVIAPERVRGLLLVIPPTAWQTRAAQADAYLVMADLVEAGDHVTLLRGAASRPVPDPFADDPRWSDRFADLLAVSDPVRLARIFRGAATADLPTIEEISRLDVPTLIVAWTGDPGHPASTAARLQELMPHAQLALAATVDGVAAWTGRVQAFLSQF